MQLPTQWQAASMAFILGQALQRDQCAATGQRGQYCCQRPLVEQECCKGREQREAEQAAAAAMLLREGVWARETDA